MRFYAVLSDMARMCVYMMSCVRYYKLSLTNAKGVFMSSQGFVLNVQYGAVRWYRTVQYNPVLCWIDQASL